MGRGCSMDEWSHFEKLPEEGRVPNSSYWYVICRHCVKGYEQKQLPSFPTKITGRRSAMVAHLKTCPIYGHQYREDIKDTSTMEDDGHDTMISTSSTKRKRKEDQGTTTPTAITTTTKSTIGVPNGGKSGRGKHCMMEEWDHFIRLTEEGYIGKSNFFQVICKYCQEAYDQAETNEQKNQLQPEKIVGRREKMRKHLNYCPFFKGDLPPLERKINLNLIVPPTEEQQQIAPTSSSAANRLALDEWHYFTRLERKPNSAYYFARCNFCMAAYETANENMKKSMGEPTVVMGRKSNMQTHLSKCPHIPKDVDVFLAAGETCVNTKQEFTSTGSNSSSSNMNTKRQRLMNGSSGSNMDLFYQTIAAFTFENELTNFDWLEKKSSQFLFRLLLTENEQNQLVSNGFLLNGQEFRTKILPQIYQKQINLQRQQLTQNLSLLPTTESESESESDNHHLCVVQVFSSDTMNRLSGKISSGKVNFPMDLIVGEDKLKSFHGLEIARWIETQVQLLGEEMKPVFCMVPFHRVFHRAQFLLNGRSKHIVFTDFTDVLLCLLNQLLRQLNVQTLVQQFLNGLQTKGKKIPDNWLQLVDLLVIYSTTSNSNTLELTEEQDKKIKALGLILQDFQAAFDAIDDDASSQVFSFAHCLLYWKKIYQTISSTHIVQVLPQITTWLTQEMEKIWKEQTFEQPLYALALSLHPFLNIGLQMPSSFFSNPTNLKEMATLYSELVFGSSVNTNKRLVNQLTAYLEQTEECFQLNFRQNFSNPKEYVKYLVVQKDYKELAGLLAIVSNLSAASRLSSSSSSHTTNSTTSTSSFTDEEKNQLKFLAENVSKKMPRIHTTSIVSETSTGGSTKTTKPRSNSQTNQLVKTYLDQLKAELDTRHVEWYQVDESTFSNGSTSSVATTQPLPSLATDDVATYPSKRLGGLRGKKLSLDQYFGAVDAVII